MTQSLQESGEAIRDMAEAFRGGISVYPDFRLTATVDGEQITFTTTAVDTDLPVEQEDEPTSYYFSCEGASDNFIELTGTECHSLRAYFDRDGKCQSIGGNYVTGQDEDGRLEYADMDVHAVERTDQDE